MHKSTIDWDDFRFFLAVARLKSARKVADELGMSHSTVSRRIQLLEAKLNNQFFEKNNRGYELTEEGITLLEFATQAEANMLQAQNILGGGSQTLAGDIQFTLPDVIASELVIPRLTEFDSQYPDIRVNLLITSQSLDIERYEADIGLRFLLKGQTPPENLVGRKVADVASSFYRPVDDDKVSAQWLGWRGPERDQLWIKQSPLPELDSRHQINNGGMQMLAVKHGLGYAMLPCFMADADSAIERLDAERVRFNHELWLVWHPSHRKVKRFQLFREFIQRVIEQNQSLLLGER